MLALRSQLSIFAAPRSKIGLGTTIVLSVLCGAVLGLRSGIAAQYPAPRILLGVSRSGLTLDSFEVGMGLARRTANIPLGALGKTLSLAMSADGQRAYLVTLAKTGRCNLCVFNVSTTGALSFGGRLSIPATTRNAMPNTRKDQLLLLGASYVGSARLDGKGRPLRFQPVEPSRRDHLALVYCSKSADGKSFLMIREGSFLETETVRYEIRKALPSGLPANEPEFKGELTDAPVLGVFQRNGEWLIPTNRGELLRFRQHGKALSKSGTTRLNGLSYPELASAWRNDILVADEKVLAFWNGSSQRAVPIQVLGNLRAILVKGAPILVSSDDKRTRLCQLSADGRSVISNVDIDEPLVLIAE